MWKYQSFKWKVRDIQSEMLDHGGEDGGEFNAKKGGFVKTSVNFVLFMMKVKLNELKKGWNYLH